MNLRNPATVILLIISIVTSFYLVRDLPHENSGALGDVEEMSLSSELTDRGLFGQIPSVEIITQKDNDTRDNINDDMM